MQGLPSILFLFHNKFNKFNLSYDIKITLKSHFCHKNIIILSLCNATLLRTSQHFPLICIPLVVYRFYWMALFHSHMISLVYDILHECQIYFLTMQAL